MNGDSADAFIASAYAFGARDFDVPGALADMVRGATDPAVTTEGHFERQDLAQYLAKGYGAGRHLRHHVIPYTVGGSETLEYAIDDFAISQLAQAAGDGATSATFVARAQNWRNLVNPATGYLARAACNGTFPPGPAFQRSPCRASARSGSRRATPSSTPGACPRTCAGLFDAIGGNTAVVAKLNTYFTELNAGRKQPYDWAGDEPSLGTPWEYDYAGAPSRTQAVVRRSPPSCTGRRPTGSRATTTWGRCRRGTCGQPWACTPRHRAAASSSWRAPLPPHHHHPRERARHRHRRAGRLARPPPTSRASTWRGWTRPPPGGCPASAGTGASPSPYRVPVVARHRERPGAELDFTLGATPDAGWGAAPTDAPPSFPAG